MIHTAGGMGNLNIPLHFATEQLNRLVQKILQQQNFANIDEANKYLTEVVSHSSLTDLSRMAGEDPVEQAQELAWQSIGAETREEALELAHRALELDPDCIDAQSTVALGTSKTPEEAIDNLRGVIQRAEDWYGPEFMKAAEGEFWSILETRPYMRAREQLMELLQQTNRIEEAFAEGETILRLNPGDNQGVRYPLLSLYLEHGKTEAARKLLDQYPDEGSAIFSWGRVLQRLLAGDLDGAGAAYQKAMKVNHYFYEFMTGQRKFPKTMPSTYGFGDVSEGLYCVRILGPAWLSHHPAMAWLVSSQGHRKVA